MAVLLLRKLEISVCVFFFVVAFLLYFAATEEWKDKTIECQKSLRRVQAAVRITMWPEFQLELSAIFDAIMNTDVNLYLI